MTSSPFRLLLVDDEPNVLRTLSISLESMGFDVTSCPGPNEALAAIVEGPHYDIAFLDLKMYPIDGIELMERVRRRLPDITVVIITAHGSVASAVEAIKQGAFDYIQKPFELEQLRLVCARAIKHHAAKVARSEARAHHAESIRHGIVTRDPAMLDLVALAERVADTPLAVLIEGESGTGKELFAELMHHAGRRHKGPFVKVNCAALPEQLLESELFGHARGAFTGALKERLGRFEMADGGTIFLDEIGELPLALQSKLLRVLQNREFERVGESTTRRIDVRVTAATNRDLVGEIRAGRFREDLFYRLNAVRLAVPPLRERTGDIPLLVDYFIEKYHAPERGPLGPSVEVLEALAANPWRGNVRELENVVSRAVYLAAGEEITLGDLPDEYRLEEAPKGPLQMSLEDVERQHIARILAESESYEEAARTLNIDVATLWRKRKRYNL